MNSVWEREKCSTSDVKCMRVGGGKPFTQKSQKRGHKQKRSKLKHYLVEGLNWLHTVGDKLILEIWITLVLNVIIVMAIWRFSIQIRFFSLLGERRFQIFSKFIKSTWLYKVKNVINCNAISNKIDGKNSETDF